MKKLFIILIILGVLIISSGCGQIKAVQKNQYNNQPREYFSKENIVKYNAGGNGKSSPEEQFETEVKEFYDFTRIFFPIWNNHIESAAPLLEKFNNRGTNLDDKIMYSQLLVKKYESFDTKVKQIKPPAVALKAYKYTLDSISRRILFFTEFEKGASIYTLIEIENEAYLYESLFWGEIDIIYDYYLGEIDKKNIVSI